MILNKISTSYKLKANDAILASDEHKGLNETLLRDYPNHQFVAGGATQNSMRGATVIISSPKFTHLFLSF